MCEDNKRLIVEKFSKIWQPCQMPNNRVVIKFINIIFRQNLSNDPLQEKRINDPFTRLKFTKNLITKS